MVCRTASSQHDQALRAFDEQLSQAVSEFGAPVQSRTAAGHAGAVATTPERRPDGMELGPSPDTLAIEFRGFGEDVHNAVTARRRSSASRSVSARDFSSVPPS
jgi:hypothetical protein